MWAFATNNCEPSEFALCWLGSACQSTDWERTRLVSRTVHTLYRLVSVKRENEIDLASCSLHYFLIGFGEKRKNLIGFAGSSSRPLLLLGRQVIGPANFKLWKYRTSTNGSRTDHMNWVVYHWFYEQFITPESIFNCPALLFGTQTNTLAKMSVKTCIIIIIIFFNGSSTKPVIRCLPFIENVSHMLDHALDCRGIFRLGSIQLVTWNPLKCICEDNEIVIWS